MKGTLFRGMCARALFLSMALVLPGFALAQGAIAVRTKAEGKGDGFQARLQAAAMRYEESEYEGAREALRLRDIAGTSPEQPGLPPPYSASRLSLNTVDCPAFTSTVLVMSLPSSLLTSRRVCLPSVTSTAESGVWPSTFPSSDTMA